MKITIFTLTVIYHSYREILFLIDSIYKQFYNNNGDKNAARE